MTGQTISHRHPQRVSPNFDVAANGKPFLFNTLCDDPPRAAIQVVLNWRAGRTR